jgi:hypothetical protein
MTSKLKAVTLATVLAASTLGGLTAASSATAAPAACPATLDRIDNALLRWSDRNALADDPHTGLGCLYYGRQVFDDPETGIEPTGFIGFCVSIVTAPSGRFLGYFYDHYDNPEFNGHITIVEDTPGSALCPTTGVHIP